MTAPVFLAEAGLLDDVAVGDVHVLEGAEARHAGVVQRRRAGERVDLVDGAGVRLRCTIDGVEPGRLRLAVTERVVEPAPPVRLELVQALAKGDRDELAIAAATEVGVDDVVPWHAGRSIVVWRGERAARSRAKWVATVREATKQARRAHVPSVADSLETRELARHVADVVAAGGTALVLHEEAARPLADVPLPGPADPAPRVTVVVGPEGGIGDDELAVLEQAGAIATRLGPHVLRTSTAGPVALALIADRLGRWV